MKNNKSHILLTRIHIKLNLNGILKDYSKFKKVQRELKQQEIFKTGYEISIIDFVDDDCSLMFTKDGLPTSWIRKEIHEYDNNNFMLRLDVASDIHLAYGNSDNETIFDFPLRLIYNYLFRVAIDSAEKDNDIIHGELVELPEYIDEIINDYNFKFSPWWEKWTGETREAYDAKWGDFEGPPEWSWIHRARLEFASKYTSISLSTQYSGDRRGMGWVSDPNYGNKDDYGEGTSLAEEDKKKWQRIKRKEFEAFQKIRELKSPS